MATTEAEEATTSAPERGGRSERAAAAISERLWARHQQMVLGLCRALLRDAAEAEDAAQQAFLSAHRALLNGAEPREPAAWLATIARNECWARTSARMREPLASQAIDEVAAVDDPVAEAIRRADLRALWRAIERLPRQQRDALLLREFGGLRYDELAAALAVSEGSVESLLFRARARLRTQLRQAYAALSGASWIDALARLLAGGGAPAAASKAVAVGLGAAAATGGAVFGPDLLTQHQHQRPARQPHVRRHAATARPVTAAPVAAAPVVAAPPPAVPVVRTVARAAPARPARVHEARPREDGRTAPASPERTAASERDDSAERPPSTAAATAAPTAGTAARTTTETTTETTTTIGFTTAGDRSDDGAQQAPDTTTTPDGGGGGGD